MDREIFRLAVPALGALVAEPLFLLTDTALVGHLGAEPLAALGIATTILQTVVGLLIFLAYATTPTVARRLGAGDRPGAISAGIDGMWLALFTGIVLALVGSVAVHPIVASFGAPEAVARGAVVYLEVSLWGLPGMLLVIAATGLLRGLQDTLTPLVVAVIGFAANAALNALFIYGFGWGIGGSAAGTVVAQWGMAVVYIFMALRAAASTGARLRPGLAGVTGAATAGGWLLLRTASLRVAMVATVYVGTGLGVTELATLQVAMTVFATLAFVLDAYAIAGQAMIGHGLGAEDVRHVTEATSRLTRLAIVSGLGLGIVLAALSPVLGFVFTAEPGVREALTPVLLTMAAGIPLAGYVFVLDGVLIGAGDARYLAWTGLANLAVYAPLLVAVALGPASGTVALLWLQAAFSFGYIGARAVTLGLRARSERWIVTGARAR